MKILVITWIKMRAGVKRLYYIDNDWRRGRNREGKKNSARKVESRPRVYLMRCIFVENGER